MTSIAASIAIELLFQGLKRTQGHDDQGQQKFVKYAGPQESKACQIFPHPELHIHNKVQKTSQSAIRRQSHFDKNLSPTLRMINNALKKPVLVALLVLSSFATSMLRVSGCAISAATNCSLASFRACLAKFSVNSWPLPSLSACVASLL